MPIDSSRAGQQFGRAEKAVVGPGGVAVVLACCRGAIEKKSKWWRRHQDDLGRIESTPNHEVRLPSVHGANQAGKPANKLRDDEGGQPRNKAPDVLECAMSRILIHARKYSTGYVIQHEAMGHDGCTSLAVHR